MNKTTKKNIVKFGIAPLLLLLLLWLIYHEVKSKGDFRQQWNELLLHLDVASPLLIAVMLLLTPANWMTEAKKWHLLLKKIEAVNYRTALASTLTGMAFAFITPNKIGDFAGRVLYVKNENKLRAVIATIVDNLSQVIVTFFAGISGIIYLNIYAPGTWQLAMLVLALAGLLVLLVIYFNTDRLAAWTEGRQRFRKILIAIRVVKRFNKRDLLHVLALSLIRFVIYNVQFVLALEIAGCDISLFSTFMLTMVMYWLITVIPSLFVVDLGVRAYVANLVFVNSGFMANTVSVLAASYLIWLLNWVLGAVIGSFLILTIRWFR